MRAVLARTVWQLLIYERAAASYDHHETRDEGVGLASGVDWFAVASLSNEVRRWHVSGNPLGRF